MQQENSSEPETAAVASPCTGQQISENLQIPYLRTLAGEETSVMVCVLEPNSAADYLACPSTLDMLERKFPMYYMGNVCHEATLLSPEGQPTACKLLVLQVHVLYISVHIIQ